jgi:hypothetical protein
MMLVWDAQVFLIFITVLHGGFDHSYCFNILCSVWLQLKLPVKSFVVLLLCFKAMWLIKGSTCRRKYYLRHGC